LGGRRNFFSWDAVLLGEVFGMKLRLLGGLVVGLMGFGVAGAQQPAGVADALANIASEHASHTAVTFDRDMLQATGGVLPNGAGPIAGLNSITFENYRYKEPAFYIPEEMHALITAYNAAGWKHLVDQGASPAQSASPDKPLTDLWLHFRGAEIDDVTVVVRARKQMSVIEVNGVLKPLDMVHLSGHFGIPKVDPSAVMVPAAPGK
jgi:hypothetical protein